MRFLLLFFVFAAGLYGAATPNQSDEILCRGVARIPGTPGASAYDAGQSDKVFWDYVEMYDQTDNSGTWHLFGQNDPPPWNAGYHLCNGIIKSDGTPLYAKSVQLVDFDFGSGTAVCKYVLQDDSVRLCRAPNDTTLIQSINYVASTNQYENGKWSDKKFWEKFDNVLGVEFPPGTDYAEKMLNHPEVNIDVRQMAKDIGLMEESEEGDDSVIDMRFSNFFTGLLLLDDAYVRGVDKLTGEIQLQPVAESKLEIVNYAENAIKSEEAESSGYVLDASLVNSFARIFDKQAFGLYVNFFDFFMKAFQYFANIMLLVAAGWFGFHASAKAGIKFIAKDKGAETNYKLQLSGLALGFAVLFMPIPGGVKSNIQNDNQTIDTTIAKNVINFFSEYGADFANYMSDGIYVEALNYYLKRFGYNTVESNQELLRFFKTIVIIGRSKELFYANNCKLAYKANFRWFSDTSNTSLEDKLSYVSTSYYDTPSARNIFNYDLIFGSGKPGGGSVLDSKVEQAVWRSNSAVAVSPAFCQKLESDLTRIAMSLRDQKGVLDRFSYNSLGADSFKKTEKFIRQQLQLQKDLGWINIVSLPLIETYVTVNALFGDGASASSGSTLDRASEMVQNVKKSKISTNEKNLQTIEEDVKGAEEENLVFSAIGVASQFSLYFVLPGFDGIYSMMSGVIREIWDISENFVVGMTARIGTPFAAVALKLFMMLLKAIGVVPVIIMLISLLTAISIYSMIIKSVFMIMVMLMILVKIFFYFLSLLKYFFITPFAIFLQLTDDNRSALGKFLGKGFILVFVKPLLIVISVAVFVITYEMLISLYNLLFALGANTVGDLNAVVDTSDSLGWIQMLQATAMSASLAPAGKVLLDFFSILIAYSIIMNGDKWMLSMLGYQEEEAGEVKELVNDIRNKVGKF